ncbi:sialidase family protein, partial [Acinetobacter baumannii]
EAGTELHATWASKNSTYANSFNIRYAKGTINADGSVTWGAVEQVTGVNAAGSDYKNPCISMYGSDVRIVFDFWNGSQAQIFIVGKNGLSNAASGSVLWRFSVIYSVASYAQSSPSAIFVPQSVNGLANGRIWVAWHGRDSTEAIDHIRISYSDDGGSTWSAMEKLTSGATNHNAMASITVNKNNDVFIMYRGQNASIASTVYDVKMLKKLASESTWTTTNFTNYTANYNDINVNPSALSDVNLDFSTPLFIYKDVKNAKVGFYGTWTIGTEAPLTENTLRLTLTKQAKEVMAYLHHTAGLTATAQVNGNVMDKTTTAEETQFTRVLGSLQDIEIEITLTRASVTDDITIDKILGGVA